MGRVQIEFTGYRGVEKWAETREQSIGPGPQRSGLKAFAEVDAAIDNLVAQSVVGVLGKIVIDPGVGGHFLTTLGARPVFGSGDQVTPDALAPKLRRDIPAFKKADGMRRIAAIGMGAQADLDETRQRAIVRFCDEVSQWQRGPRLSAELFFELACVFFERGIRPQRETERSKRTSIRGASGVDENYCHARKG